MGWNRSGLPSSPSSVFRIPITKGLVTLNPSMPSPSNNERPPEKWTKSRASQLVVSVGSAIGGDTTVKVVSVVPPLRCLPACPTQTTPPGFVECPICHKDIKKQWFPQHEKTHLVTNKRYQCDVCGSRFTRKGDVTRHQQSSHSDGEVSAPSLPTVVKKQGSALRCQVCHTKFRKRKYFEDHIRIIHPSGASPKETKDIALPEESIVVVKQPIAQAELGVGSETHATVEELGQRIIVVRKDQSLATEGAQEVVTSQEDTSHDAVQTLIDAVEELIQSHDEGTLVPPQTK